FFEAAKIIELNGYLALDEEGLSLLTNERLTTYQGEDFEKVLVHLYLALNFMALDDWDSALVEARRVNEILYVMKSKGGRPYDDNFFAHYLSGSLFEKDRDFNSALVSYRKTYEAYSTLPFLAQDIVRMLKRLGMMD